MADASESDNGTLRNSGGGGSGEPPTMRFSVNDSNGASPRSAGEGASGVPKKMDECEGVKKCITMEDKGGGGNGTLRTAVGGGSGSPPIMGLLFEDSNRVSPKSASRSASRAPRTMDEWEGSN